MQVLGYDSLMARDPSHLCNSRAKTSALNITFSGCDSRLALRSDTQKDSLTLAVSECLKPVLLTEGFKTTAELKSTQACLLNHPERSSRQSSTFTQITSQLLLEQSVHGSLCKWADSQND